MSRLMLVPIIFLAINFFISGLFLNIAQLFLWLTVRPASIWLYRKMNYYFLYAMWIQIVFLADWWSASTCSIMTDDETFARMGKEHALVIMNHSYEVDWLMGWIVCEQSRVLASSKVFMKKAIKWVPIVGWAWQFAEVVFLERNWEKDKKAMEHQVDNLTTYPDPVWLLLFAEGTRYTPAKHAASVEFARKSGLPPLQHLLIPRTKGFLATVEQLRGKFPAVYSCTIAFNLKQGATPTLKNLLLGRRVMGEMLVERIPLDSIPEDPIQATEWLHESYRQKDQLLSIYKRESRFPSDLPENRHLNGPIKCHYRPRRLWSLLIIVISCYLTLPPVCRALLVLLSSGLVNIGVAFCIITAILVALYKLVGLTKVSKASTYGSDKLSAKSS